MSEHGRRPLGRVEIELLVPLADGNALTRQRRQTGKPAVHDRVIGRANSTAASPLA